MSSTNTNQYTGWSLDQHPKAMLEQMERQIRGGQAFISEFAWSPKWKEYLSVGVRVEDTGRSVWIFRKGRSRQVIDMWDGERIINPLHRLWQKKQSLSQKCRKLMIERRAYAGTDQFQRIEAEIEAIEREREMAIDEIAEQ